MTQDDNTGNEDGQDAERVSARIVDAEKKDADAISRLLVASITELCSPDHRGDDGLISQWTENKTVERVTQWIEDPQQRLLVGWERDELVSVGAIGPGIVHLNYVAPHHRFRGHSKAMLGVMEACLMMIGTPNARLTSTATAKRFYRTRGWIEAGEPIEMFGLMGFPMTKQLHED
ncbi:MAG: GNAT family N-acetyltransferase [Pseudomonadota bacterium]